MLVVVLKWSLNFQEASWNSRKFLSFLGPWKPRISEKIYWTSEKLTKRPNILNENTLELLKNLQHFFFLMSEKVAKFHKLNPEQRVVVLPKILRPFLNNISQLIKLDSLFVTIQKMFISSVLSQNCDSLFLSCYWKNHNLL